MNCSALFKRVNGSCRPPVETRYWRVSGWYDRRTLRVVLTGLSSNQYQRERESWKSTAK
jgi:hypothetical protein